MRPRLLFLLVLGATGMGPGVPARAQMFGAARYQATDTAGRPTSQYGWIIAAWERALGLPTLRSVSLPDGWREVRAWMGFGLIVPGELVRIVQAPDTTAGRLVLVWSRPSHKGTATEEPGLHRFEYDMQRLYRCPAILTGETSPADGDEGRACIARRPGPFDWQAVQDSLDALGVWTIRNGTKLECLAVDGVTLVVESLAGARYRTWCYVPGNTKPPAAAIATLLQGVPPQFADSAEDARLGREAEAEEAARDSARRTRADSVRAARVHADSVMRAERTARRRRYAWPPPGFERAPADSSIVWIAQHADSTTAFRGLSAPSDTVAWASGSGGLVARTTDGGHSWTTHRIPGADSLFMVGVAAFDARTAVVLGTRFSGGLAEVFRTEDGGATWRVQYTDARPGAFYDGIACWDARRCVAFGDAVDGRLAVVRTTDGAHWRRVTGPVLPAALPGEAGFAASGTAITVAGADHAWIATGGGDRARVYRTQDGGRTWHVADTPLPAGQSAGIFGIAFHDTLHGLAVGGDYAKPDDPAPNVLRTEDGGRTWRLVGSTNPPGIKWGLVAVPAMENTYVAVSPGGTAFTVDGGTTWTAIEGPGYNTVVFVTPAAGWVAGDGGRIARASNAPHP